MRAWLLTNTTYGTWLPGDPRGSITSVRDERPGDAPSSIRFEHDVPGEPWEEHLPGLHEAAREQMSGPPIYLCRAQAEIILAQFQETASYRRWALSGVAIMSNHFHLVVQVAHDPSPSKILADFKAYGSRALNRAYGVPQSETWWTSRGSKRKLRDDQYFAAAMNYVLHKQPSPLVVWSHDEGRLV